MSSSLTTVDVLGPGYGANVLRDAILLLEEFREDGRGLSLDGWPTEIHHEALPAPHEQPGLPDGYGAVYAFSLADSYGEGVRAGAGRVLKVGRAGPNSDARFRSQHYGLGAGSTLAGSLLHYRVLWPWLGIDDLTERTVKDWIRQHLDWDHFFVPAGSASLLPTPEVYIRGRVGSVFEGAAAPNLRSSGPAHEPAAPAHGPPVEHRPTWELVLEAIEQLTARGTTSFALRDLIVEVQKLDPHRDRSSIQPIVQGMTANTGIGASSPAGKVLVRVERGRYAPRP